MIGETSAESSKLVCFCKTNTNVECSYGKLYMLSVFSYVCCVMSLWLCGMNTYLETLGPKGAPIIASLCGLTLYLFISGACNYLRICVHTPSVYIYMKKKYIYIYIYLGVVHACIITPPTL